MQDKSLEQHNTDLASVMEKFRAAPQGEAIHLTPDEAQTMRTEGVLQTNNAQMTQLNRAQRRKRGK